MDRREAINNSSMCLGVDMGQELEQECADVAAGRNFRPDHSAQGPVSMEPE